MFCNGFLKKTYWCKDGSLFFSHFKSLQPFPMCETIVILCAVTCQSRMGRSPEGLLSKGTAGQVAEDSCFEKLWKTQGWEQRKTEKCYVLSFFTSSFRFFCASSILCYWQCTITSAQDTSCPNVPVLNLARKQTQYFSTLPQSTGEGFRSTSASLAVPIVPILLHTKHSSRTQQCLHKAF